MVSVLNGGGRSTAALLLVFLLMGIFLTPSVRGQPGQWRLLNPGFDGGGFNNLNDVWFVNSNDAWAVGDDSTLLHWDGTLWKRIQAPSNPANANVESVSCGSSTNCVAVGTEAGAAFMWRWDGTSWIEVTVPAGVAELRAVHVRSDGLGFAVGKNDGGGAPDFNILLINSPPSSGSFSVVGCTDVGAGDILFGVHMTSPSAVGTAKGFAVGDDGAAAGTTWRWDGAACPGGWLEKTAAAAIGVLRDIYMVDANVAFAVGDGDAIERWNGGSQSWDTEFGPVIPTDWLGVHMLSSTDGWIVGKDSGGFISFTRGPSSGSTYSNLPSSSDPTSFTPAGVDFLAVFLLSTSDGWAVGEVGTILRWTGGNSWNVVSSPTNYDLNGVWLASGMSDGWAVGDSGRIFRRIGGFWNLYTTSLTTVDLLDVHGSSSSDVWVVGKDPGAGLPVILRFGGSGFTSLSPPGVADGHDLRTVYALSSSLAFVGGGTGSSAMLQCNSSGGPPCVSIPSGMAGANEVRGIWMVDSDTGFAVGGVAGGTGVSSIWNGVTWSADGTFSDNLNDVQALSETNVWAVGEDGLIAHRDGTGWQVVPGGLGAGDNLRSIYMVSATEGWAVGIEAGTGDPLLLYWDGITWSEVRAVPDQGGLPAGFDLNAIWLVASSPASGFAVGQSGTMMQFGAISGITVVIVQVTVTSTSTQFVTSSVAIATTSVTSTSTQQVTATNTVATATLSTDVTSTSTITVSGTTTEVVATVPATATVTVTTSTATVQAPPIPGFPLESILAGLVAGLAAVFLIHRRRRV